MGCYDTGTAGELKCCQAASEEKLSEYHRGFSSSSARHMYRQSQLLTAPFNVHVQGLEKEHWKNLHMCPTEDYVGGLCGKTNKIVSSRKVLEVLNIDIRITITETPDCINSVKVICIQ